MVSCSIHLTDSGVKGFFRPAVPDPVDVPGLLSAQRLTAAGFSGKPWPGAPQLGRNGFLAFWKDDEALTSFAESADPGEWHVRTTPTRAIGRWPGLPTDIDRSVHRDSESPVVGVSLGPLRLRRSVRFNQLNTRIEAQLLSAEGALWKSAFFALPNILCTISFWESASHLHAFARSGAHREGMEASMEKDFDPSLPNGTNFFHPDSVFMSLRPYRTEGSLGGKNRLAPGILGAMLQSD